MKNYPKVSFFDRILCIQIWEIIMERNIIGDLLILKQMNIKLNFSELAGIYDMDSHTVAKYWRYKSQDNLTNLLQLSVLSFFRI